MEEPGPDQPATRRHQRDSILAAGSNLLVFALSLLTGPLLGRGLGPVGRGELAAVLAPTQLWSWATTLGLPASTSYLAPLRPREELLATAWIATALINLPLVGLLWFFIPPYLSGHNPHNVVWFRALLLVGLFALPAFSTLSHLNSSGKTVEFTLLRHLPAVSYALVVIVLGVLGALTVQAVLIAAAVTLAMGHGVALVVGRGRLHGRRFRWRTAKAQFRYGIRLAPGQWANLAVGRLDQLAMVRLVSAAELGRYAVAATAANVTGALGQGVAIALFPRVRQASSNRERRRAIRRARRWVFAGSSTIALLLGLSGTWLLPALFGPGFASSVDALWLLLPGQVAYDVAVVLGTGLQAQGRPGTYTGGLLLATAITVIGVVPAVNAFGIRGAAGLTSVSQLVALAYLAKASRGVRSIASLDE